MYLCQKTKMMKAVTIQQLQNMIADLSISHAATEKMLSEKFQKTDLKFKEISNAIKDAMNLFTTPVGAAHGKPRRR